MGTKMTLELKVGIFVFIGVIILTLSVFSISEIYIFRPGYKIQVIFSFASGIDVGAGVRVAGIEVGEVKDIKMHYDTNEARAKIVLSVWLDKEVKIPQDSQAYANILGLIGESYLEIIPGGDYTHLLKDGDVLVGRDPVSSETLMEVAHKVGGSLNEALASINEILDSQAKADLKESIYNFRIFSQSLKAVAEELEQGAVANSLALALDSVNEVLDIETKADLKESIHNLRQLSHSLKVIAERLERGEGRLGAWLKSKKILEKKTKK